VDQPPSSPGHHISRIAFTLSTKQRHGLAGVQHYDGVGIDRSHFLNEFVLLTRQSETGLIRAQTKTTATLAFFAAAMAAS